MSPKQLIYWDYDQAAALECPGCGWNGCGDNNEEYYKELLDVCCPSCGRMLLIVAYPTPEETRAAAAAGNEAAQAELRNVEAREGFLERATALQLKSPSELPDLPGDEIVVDWDFETDDEGERHTVLRFEGREIWRELAYYEGYLRFEKVLEILGSGMETA